MTHPDLPRRRTELPILPVSHNSALPIALDLCFGRPFLGSVTPAGFEPQFLGRCGHLECSGEGGICSVEQQLSSGMVNPVSTQKAIPDAQLSPVCVLFNLCVNDPEMDKQQV